MVRIIHSPVSPSALAALGPAGRQRLATVRPTRASQKMLAQSVFMLTIVQPRLPACSSTCSAPLV
jgi:hypothetical protein